MNRTVEIEAEITELEKAQTQAEADGIDTKLQIEESKAKTVKKVELEKQSAAKIETKKAQVENLKGASEIFNKDGRWVGA